jgi:hypothetical protein
MRSSAERCNAKTPQRKALQRRTYRLPRKGHDAKTLQPKMPRRANATTENATTCKTSQRHAMARITLHRTPFYSMPPPSNFSVPADRNNGFSDSRISTCKPMPSASTTTRPPSETTSCCYHSTDSSSATTLRCSTSCRQIASPLPLAVPGLKHASRPETLTFFAGVTVPLHRSPRAPSSCIGIATRTPLRQSLDRHGICPPQTRTPLCFLPP